MAGCLSLRRERCSPITSKPDPQGAPSLDVLSEGRLCLSAEIGIRSGTGGSPKLIAPNRAFLPTGTRPLYDTAHWPPRRSLAAFSGRHKFLRDPTRPRLRPSPFIPQRRNSRTRTTPYATCTLPLDNTLTAPSASLLYENSPRNSPIALPTEPETRSLTSKTFRVKTILAVCWLKGGVFLPEDTPMPRLSNARVPEHQVPVPPVTAAVPRSVPSITTFTLRLTLQPGATRRSTTVARPQP